MKGVNIMERIITIDELKALKSYYPPGTRVELVCMEDPYTKLKPGDQGTVSLIDDAGTVFVNWDSGSRLGVVFGEDEIRRIKENKND
jgi:hypothetical protein